MNTVRLIPACAGKTFSSVFGSLVPAAHPRVCGENAFLEVPGKGHLGSSPRVRGKHRGMLHGGAGGGLIPACAGKTYDTAYHTGNWGAHPRVCGENGLALTVVGE